jgi:2-oxoglutarate ferredoxin oxidoreductase subunit gamma
VCLTQEALDRFSGMIRPGGLLLADRSTARRLGPVDARAFALPMFQAVRERIGTPIVFNACVLGALAGLVDLVRPQAIADVLASRVPARFLDQNLRALDLGLELAREARPAPAAEEGPSKREDAPPGPAAGPVSTP